MRHCNRGSTARSQGQQGLLPRTEALPQLRCLLTHQLDNEHEDFQTCLVLCPFSLTRSGLQVGVSVQINE